ncbi:hypothetical protein N7488_006816 [Penicillium malachiteum]|nr:hypothetical protein N7488_006816 [Penicillium malachiteum]
MKYTEVYTLNKVITSLSYSNFKDTLKFFKALPTDRPTASQTKPQSPATKTKSITPQQRRSHSPLASPVSVQRSRLPTVSSSKRYKSQVRSYKTHQRDKEEEIVAAYATIDECNSEIIGKMIFYSFLGWTLN